MPAPFIVNSKLKKEQEPKEQQILDIIADVKKKLAGNEKYTTDIADIAIEREVAKRISDEILEKYDAIRSNQCFVGPQSAQSHVLSNKLSTIYRNPQSQKPLEELQKTILDFKQSKEEYKSMNANRTIKTSMYQAVSIALLGEASKRKSPNMLSRFFSSLFNKKPAGAKQPENHNSHQKKR